MQYLQRSTKQEVLQLQRNLQSYFTLCGEKKPSLKNSRMQQLSTYSKGKGILKSVTIIEASLYCQLLGRSLIGSYWTDWMNTSTSHPDTSFHLSSKSAFLFWIWLCWGLTTLVGHFVSSPREREKRDSRGDKREGQGRKRNGNESEETEEIKTFSLYPYLLQG